jgi:DNA-binding response OmpR family regulator
MRFLIVEDELKMASLVRRGLAEEGHAADVATSGEDALWMAEAHPYEAIVLDVMLPGRDGFETCRELRRAGVWAPVLMLTARDSVGDRVNGLDAGADDYLTKPFSFDVLLARIRARTRSAPGDGKRLRFADLILDPGSREVRRGPRRIVLTRTEFALLECLMRASGRVVSRDSLIEQVWADREVTPNNLEVFVRFLRAKIDREGEDRLIHTERGVGYSLRSPEP